MTHCQECKSCLMLSILALSIKLLRENERRKFVPEREMSLCCIQSKIHLNLSCVFMNRDNINGKSVVLLGMKSQFSMQRTIEQLVTVWFFTLWFYCSTDCSCHQLLPIYPGETMNLLCYHPRLTAGNLIRLLKKPGVFWRLLRLSQIGCCLWTVLVKSQVH